MKLLSFNISKLFGAPYPHPVFEAAKAIIIAEAKIAEEKMLLSIRSVVNCNEDKARKIIKICIRHNCSPNTVLDLLVMGWSFRQSIKLASNGVTARICHVLNKWPKRIKPTE